jgi:hypothetical protein
MPAELVANTSRNPNGEPSDDEGRGQKPGRKGRVRLHETEEKSRSRNLMIPDSLYDQLYLYARRTKVKAKEERIVNNRKQEAVYRSMTVSEAACKALASFLPKGRLTIVEDGESPPAAE